MISYYVVHNIIVSHGLTASRPKPVPRLLQGDLQKANPCPRLGQERLSALGARLGSDSGGGFGLASHFQVLNLLAEVNTAATVGGGGVAAAATGAATASAVAPRPVSSVFLSPAFLCGLRQCDAVVWIC